MMLALAMVGIMLATMGSARAAWIPSAQLSGGPPAIIYPDESAAFTYHLKIGSISGSSSVEIRSFSVMMDWEDGPTELVSSTIVYALPDTHTFTRNVVVPHVGVAIGTHSARIEVVGKANGDWWTSTETWTQEFSVGVRDPLTLSVSANPTSGPTPMAVTFNPTASGGTPGYTYQIAYGDGSSGANLGHTYSTAGAFVATVTVTDGLGRTAVATCSVNAFTPLSIAGSADVRSGKAPMTVHFNGAASGGSPSYSYMWIFGDGSTSTETSPSHRYSEPGTYEVTLTVTDSQTRQSVFRTTITVDQADVGSAMADAGIGSIMVIILVVAAAAIVGVVLIIRGRKKKQP
jgi:PKD repeat protein